jgi:hypothetical protein
MLANFTLLSAGHVAVKQKRQERIADHDGLWSDGNVRDRMLLEQPRQTAADPAILGAARSLPGSFRPVEGRPELKRRLIAVIDDLERQGLARELARRYRIAPLIRRSAFN